MAILLALGGCFGLAFALLTPPFASPDEATHLFRSYQLSEGRIFAEKTGERLGGRLPAAVPDDVSALDDATAGAGWEEIRDALGHEVDGPRRFVDFQNTALYPPLTYAPQVAGIAVGRLFGASTLTLLYLGRVANLVAFLGLTAVLARRFPRSGWIPVAVALLPVTLFLAGSLSADVLTVALCGLALTEARRAERPWTFLLVCVALGLSKPPYFLVTLLPLALWLRAGRAGWHVPAGVASAFALGIAWSRWAAHVFVPYRPIIQPDLDVRPDDQLSFVLGHPLDVLGALLRTAGEDLDMWGRQLLAPWGQRIDAPSSVALGSLALLVLVALAGPWRPETELPRLIRWVAAGVVLVVFGATIGAVYLYSNEVGADRIRLVYGRYWLPLLPLVLLAVPRPARVAWLADRPRAFDALAGGAAAVLLLFGLAATV